MTLADRVLSNAPLAVQASRRLILEAPEQSDAEGMSAASAAMAALSSSEDYTEGPRAFIEKRASEWKGR